MDDYRRANRDLWNEWADIHARSDFYDMEGFKAGKSSLQAFEIDELGEVTGKSFLHLQCHFGMDTLSWARLGARVVGVDFSERAIELASELNQELGLDVDFVCADIYELPEVLQGQFDVVYTSHGVLAWLPDLERWGQIIARFLKTGGIFYMSEFHPYAYVFDDDERVSELKVRYPYFHSSEPMVFEVQGSYADRGAQVEQDLSYEWAHSLSDVLNALLSAGLRLEFLHEYPFSVFALFPSLMEKGPEGMWRLKEADGMIPLMFSLKASK